MIINIDPNSGFCFGVVNAIKMVEKTLESNGKLYCLGDIVHNNTEVERLKKKGLIIIDHSEFEKLKDCKVLIRAHGEPPSTYQIAKKNNIQIIDATCPVVLKLQKKIKKGYDDRSEEKNQIVIYGKKKHAEVIGLEGQTDNNAIIINSIEDIQQIDFTKSINLYSQTTQSTKGLEDIIFAIKEKIKTQKIGKLINFKYYDTICRQVANREPQLQLFAKQHELILFVSGKDSSNGLFLYEVCKKVNPKTYFISTDCDIEYNWLKNVKSIGICGATSTPMWLMLKVENYLKTKFI
ncbi:MAG: 4-hydroxy-3-methylbut-2-enyl diphosphate reductase [Bacteroidetes bacterium GWE2_29_8]|nr:MAG: 4-hydroxy-3-methylbut-2-enyl diphosphate reductase [Bacteroidetes bacterium GWE2_29_8]OFY17990.1 MAG: 4-hydroxy-3-methylbut-2-enyl diphosphate reductase [Bacteroidetes bacterium GWF2_29_10]